MKRFFQSFAKSRHTIPLIIIVVGVIAANGIYLFTGSDPNPVYQRTDLRISSVPGTLGGHNTIDPNDGFTAQALGHLAAKDWLNGSIPYWNHYEGVGTPLAGEMQSASFLPLGLLLSLNNGLLYFHIALEMIAGAAIYYLLIKLKLNRRIAVFGGVAFALNGTFAWITNAAFNPVAFLPVLLLGIELAYLAAKEHKRRGWILVAIGIACSVCAGFPETAYFDGLLGLVWAVARFWQLHDNTLRKAFSRKVIIGGVTGILLAAPVLAAFHGYLTDANIGTHAHAYTSGLVPIGLSNLFMPYIFGPIFGYFNYDNSGQLLALWSKVGGYLTVSLILLAIFGAISKKDRILKRFLAGWVVVVVLGTYGLFGIMHVLNLVPGIKSAMFYRYVTPSFELAIIILAAFGLAELSEDKVSKKTRIIIVAVMAGIIAAGIINAIPEIHHLAIAPGHLRWAALSGAIAVGSVALISAVLFLKDKKVQQYALICIALAEVFVMFMIPQLSTPRQQKIDTQPVSYLQNHLGQYRFFTLSPIQPNYGSYYKIASININDVPIPKSYSEHILKDLNGNVDPQVFVGDQMKNPHGLKPLQAFATNIEAYQKLSVKYLVALPGSVPNSVVSQTGITKVFASRAADIFELPNPKPYFETTQGNCQLTSHGKDALTAVCRQSATLLRREQFMDGWAAKVNGKDVAVKQHDDLFQAIMLPAGTSQVKYHYAPPHIDIVYIAVAAGLVIIIVGYIRGSERTRK